ncbi:MAG TPA: DegT/DnrJ/EryC1/StrS family aminotransferase [Verrucomicrobiae bacterium]|jgi:dTDP-4-amino-4,6-dideoxygalactose transaminase|nr:DegT/DnrJ/EryC1/StrS family aminotransferase [Verrucomicrobiae bacterium]
MKVPFLDLQAHHQPIREQIEAAIGDVIDKNAFSGGPFVAAFESDFARYCGCKHVVGVGSGTDALWLSLLALKVGPGDEVITVPNTFAATAEAIRNCGARPKFVDIDEQTYTMDPALLQQAINPRTKAIIPVHLLGQCADMDPIVEIASRRGIPVVEDACQAHGALYKDRKAGTMGTLGCFSFYPGKNLGALGEAGAVTTDDQELAARIQVFRDHGQDRKYQHSVVGWNARLDGIQGAVLSIKLKHLDVNNVRRRAHALQYDQLLGGMEEIVTPFEAPHNRHVYHVYAVRVQARNQVLQALAERGISCAIHYPVPVHLQEAYRFLGCEEGSFPVTERCAQEFLSLPMFPELTHQQIRAVATELKSCMSGKKPQRSCLKQ